MTVRLPAVLAGLAAALALPGGAFAADATPTTKVTGGTTTATLSGVAARQLAAAGVRVSPAGKVTRRSGGFRLRIAGGSLSTTSKIDHARRDGLTFRRGARRVTISDITLRLSDKPTLRARIGGGPALIVARAKRGRLALSADGSTGRRSRITWVLAPTAAGKLRSALGVRKLAAGGILRTAVSATATPSGTPAPQDPTAPAADAVVQTGTADWGVRASFRRYITGPISGGTVGSADGAIRTQDGGFRFIGGSGSINRGTWATDVRFKGTAVFDGHQGDLQVRISNPRVVIAAGAKRGVLHVDATSKDRESGQVKTYVDLIVADLDLAKATRKLDGTNVTWSGITGKLTESGVPAFGGFYNPGAELDPISFTVVAAT